MQLDVYTPSAVDASTTGIAVTQSVVEITAATAISLVREAARPRARPPVRSPAMSARKRRGRGHIPASVLAFLVRFVFVG